MRGLGWRGFMRGGVGVVGRGAGGVVGLVGGEVEAEGREGEDDFLHSLSIWRLHGVWKGSNEEGSGCSAIIYRRSPHGGEGGERICSDGFAVMQRMFNSLRDTHESSSMCSSCSQILEFVFGVSRA